MKTPDIHPSHVNANADVTDDVVEQLITPGPVDDRPADVADNGSIILALRPKEAARALGIGERLLWQQTNAGEIPHCRIGRTVLYPVAALQEWLNVSAAKAFRRR